MSCCPPEEVLLLEQRMCRRCSPALQAVPLLSEVVCSQNRALITLKSFPEQEMLTLVLCSHLKHSCVRYENCF